MKAQLTNPSLPLAPLTQVSSSTSLSSDTRLKESTPQEQRLQDTFASQSTSHLTENKPKRQALAAKAYARLNNQAPSNSIHEPKFFPPSLSKPFEAAATNQIQQMSPHELLAFKDQMQKLQQEFQLLVTISKKMHDISMSILSKI